MNIGPSRNKLRYKNHCKYCGREFNAKRSSTLVCDRGECQRRKGSENNHKKYVTSVRRKWEESDSVVDQIHYLELCLKHEVLYNNGEPNQEKIESIKKQIQELCI